MKDIPTPEADAEKWGNALNDASWEYVDAFREILGRNLEGDHWNAAKTILRRAVLKYFESLNTRGALNSSHFLSEQGRPVFSERERLMLDALIRTESQRSRLLALAEHSTDAHACTCSGCTADRAKLLKIKAEILKQTEPTK